MMPGIYAPRDYSGVGAGGELTAAEEAWVQAGAAGTLNLFAGDDVYYGAGNTSANPDVRWGWNTSQTVDAFYLGLSDGQNTFIIAENGDRAFDFAHGAQTNLTLFIHSAVQNTAQWISLAHNQTDGVLNVGTGSISVNSLFTHSAGVAITAGSYQAGRDTDATNQYHINVPTGAGMEISINDVAQVVMASTGNIGIGAAASATVKLLVNQTQDGSASWLGVQSTADITPAANTASSFSSFYATTVVRSAFNFTGTVMGGFFTVTHSGTGTVTEGLGTYGQFSTGTAGSTTTAAGITGRIVNNTVGSTVTDAIGLWARPFVGAGGINTNSYGAKIDPPGFGTTQWTLWVGTGDSSVAGSITIGASATPSARLDVQQPVITSGSPTAFRVRSGAHTTLAASTEAIPVLFDLDATVQYATGALGIQRGVSIENQTIAFVGASTLDNGTTLNITGPPISGANCTITEAYALGFLAFDTANTNTGTTAFVNLNRLGIANGIGAVTTLSELRFSGGTASLGNQTATLTNLNQIRIETYEYSSTTNTRTVTNPHTVYIGGAPTAGANVTFTNVATALYVNSGLIRALGGISFANSGQSTFNNYTEGTYTPTVTLVGGAGNTVPVYSTNTGRYTRIGNRVFIDIYFTGDGGAEGAGTGTVNISLPIAAGASNPAGALEIGRAINGAVEYLLAGEITGGATTVSLSYYNLISTTAAFTGVDQNNTTRTIRLRFFYEV